MPLKTKVGNLLYRALRRWTTRPGARQPAANCILVLQYMLPLGGCVHATPLFEALRDGFPNLPVYVATRGLGGEVLRHNPSLAGLIMTSDVFVSMCRTGRELREALRSRGMHPAWVITDAGNRRSKIALMSALYVKAPLAGYSLAADLQQVALKVDPARSMIANTLAIASTLGISGAHREPKVFVSESEIEDARRLLAEINPQGKPVVIFATQPSGGQPTEWRDARWREVIRHAASHGLLPLFAGVASQAAAIDRIRENSGAATASLAGKTDVPTLAAVLALADACISIDTGTLHVARAAGVPLVALAPTYQDPVEWLPLGLPTARVLRGKGTAPVSPDYRLDEIESADVVTALTELLQTYPPQLASREARLRAMTSSVDHLCPVG